MNEVPINAPPQRKTARRSGTENHQARITSHFVSDYQGHLSNWCSGSASWRTAIFLEQFALPCAREERISLVKTLFATRQFMQTNSKDALERRVLHGHKKHESVLTRSLLTEAHDFPVRSISPNNQIAIRDGGRS